MKNLRILMIALVSVFCFMSFVPLIHADATRITSCMRQLTIETQISNDWLRRNISGDAVATNINNVEVNIYHSFITKDGYVHCQYKSRNGDIPNLVYKYPCPGARKDPAGGYEHRYICTR